MGIDPSEFVELCHDRIVHAHLKDVDDHMAGSVRRGAINFHDAVFSGLFRPIGRGHARIPAVLEALRRSRYGGWYVLEQDMVLAAEPPPGDGPLEAAAESLAYLESLPA